MPGSGNYGKQPGQPLGQGVKEELLSALRLLFKSAEQYPLDLSISTGFTAILTVIPAEALPVPIETSVPAFSADPIAALQRTPETVSLPLLTEAVLADAAPCELASVFCSEPVFHAMALETQGVSFGNLACLPSLGWPLAALETTSLPLAIEKPARPPWRHLKPEPMKTRSRELPNAFSKVKSHPEHRFYTLPIKKSPIPAHRFNLSVREQFRQALAEKGGTHSANIQLKMIFERLDMALYGNVQPDAQGNLLCTPRNELLGKNLRRSANVSAGAAYLVIGTRLDSRQDIRALVPAAHLNLENPL